MKNLKRILSFFIVMGFMFVMFGFRVGVKATSRTVTYTVTAVDAVEVSGYSSKTSATYSQTYATAKQATANNSFTLEVTFNANCTITNITLSMHSNSQSGTGSLSATIGNTSVWSIASAQFKSNTWNGAWSSEYVDISSGALEQSITSGQVLRIHIDVTVKSLFCESYTITYEDGTQEQSVSITQPNSSDLMVGNTLQLNSSTQHIDSISSNVWSSSNTGVATVSNTGLVTPVAIGTTNIKRTVNGIESNVISLKIWPSNASNISVATAIEIAGQLDDNATSIYSYSCQGTVKEYKTTKNFVLTDGNDDILIYGSIVHNLSEGDQVIVTGPIKNYKSGDTYTPEFVQTSYGYTVTFDSNGGSPTYDSVTGLASGSTVSNPGTPTKDGYNFVGWYNGNDEWDFNNDTISTSTTIVARWASNAAQTAINNALESTNAYMSLAYGYTLNKVDNPTIYTKATSISHLHAGDSVIIISKFDGNYYALKNNGSSTGPSEAIEITNDTIENIDSSCVWTLEGNSISGWNLKSNSKYIYNPSSTTLNLDSSDKTTFTFVIDENKTYFKSADRAMFYYEKDATKSFKNYAISNFGGSYYASETYIFVKQATAKYSFRDVDFRIRCAIDDSLAILNEDYSVTLGIEVTAGGQTRKYHNGASFQNGNGKFFVTLDLGDMLNTNYANLDTEFTVRAYVEYQGAYFYSTNSKTYSVKGMVENYYKVQHIDAVSEMKEILEKYGYTFD